MKFFQLTFVLLALSACNSNTPASQPSGTPSTGSPTSETVSFSTAQAIINQRCHSCHSQNPTQAGFGGGPAGNTTFDTPEQIKAKAERIKFRAVTTKSMPQGNATGITEAEREQLGRWVDQGANIQ